MTDITVYLVLNLQLHNLLSVRKRPDSQTPVVGAGDEAVVVPELDGEHVARVGGYQAYSALLRPVHIPQGTGICTNHALEHSHVHR